MRAVGGGGASLVASDALRHGAVDVVPSAGAQPTVPSREGPRPHSKAVERLRAQLPPELLAVLIDQLVCSKARVLLLNVRPADRAWGVGRARA